MSGRTLVVDFDGTVTEDDLLDSVAKRFGDLDVYNKLDEALDEGRVGLREVIVGEYEPVTASLDEVLGWAFENIHIRPGFREFVERAKAHGFRVVIVSSGFHELIEPFLKREGVEVELHANRVDPNPDGWIVDWRYDETCENCGESCKRSIVQEFAGGGELVYVGDGYSDRCAAEASDRVFATRALAGYLSERGVAYEPFDDFHDVARGLVS